MDLRFSQPRLLAGIFSFSLLPHAVASDLRVSIAVDPGAKEDSIRCAEQVIIRVAILTTEDFDAATIDHASVSFHGAAETEIDALSGAPVRREVDADGDGDLDLLLHFRFGDTSLTCDAQRAELTGRTFDGKNVTGADRIAFARVISPRAVKRTAPRYTREAIRAGVEGTLVLQAVVRHNGTADSFKVIQGLGYGLEESAIEEIRKKWKFEPGTLRGKPVDTLVTIELKFQLSRN